MYRDSVRALPRLALRRLLPLAAGLALSAATPARANGRPPSSVSIAVSPDGRELFAGTTFGALLSRDGGCSFHWLCEQSIGFGGTFDPKYALGADGTIYAATFEGLRISRDGGCTFSTATAGKPRSEPGALEGLWVDAIELLPDGAVWVATADSGSPNDVLRSRDAGRTFEPMGLASPAIWWKSVLHAPSAPTRLYATGYQVAGTLPGGGQAPPTAHLRRTDDGGRTWQAMPLRGLTVATTPIVHVLAVDPQHPDTLYLRAARAAPPGDRLYRSTDGGLSFAEVLATSEPIAAVVARPGVVHVAAGAGGLYESLDGGQTFAAVPGAPQLACLIAAPGGGLLGCASNWDPDFFALGRSSDGRTWQKLLRFGELAGALACPDGTPQRDTCEAAQWPALREQLGVSGPATSCPLVDEPPPRRGGGCCHAGSGGAWWLGVLFVAGLLGRRRTTPRSSPER